MMALGLTFGSAGLGFAMGAMLLPVHEATGWSKPAVALGTTVCMLGAVLAAPLIGRAVDRGKGVEAMTLAALWGGLMLIAVAQARELWQWYLAWALAGPGFAGMLYEPAFAFFTRRLGTEARGAIIRMTLVAGFTSSLAFTFGGAMTALFGWRGAWTAFGLLSLLGAAPLYWIGGTLLRRGERAPTRESLPTQGAIRNAMAQRRFWLLAGSYSLMTLNHAMLLTLTIPAFTALGATTVQATVAASLIGPFQVLGRFGLMLASGGSRPRPMTLLMMAMMLAGAGCLLAAGAALWLIGGFVVLQGISIGIISILRPLLTAEVMGTRDFGAITGTLSIGGLLASAIAPTLGALVFEAGGTPWLALTSLAVLTASLLFCLALPAAARAR